jgi:hypothetical protein
VPQGIMDRPAVSLEAARNLKNSKRSRYTRSGCAREPRRQCNGCSNDPRTQDGDRRVSQR